MTIIDELKIKYAHYPVGYVDNRVAAWQQQHPSESLEKLRELLCPHENTPNFEIRPFPGCNEKCIHCFNGDNNEKVHVPTMEELYSEVDRMGPKGGVCVIGGEPTLRKDLAVLLKYIREKGLEVNLHTNGLRLADREYLEGLIPYVDLLVFPLHSSDYSVFDSITQVKGSAETAWKVFKDIVQMNRITIVTQTVINQLNYKTLLETFDKIQNISPEIRMMLTFPTPSGAAHTIKVTPKYSDIATYIQPVLKKYTYLLNIRDIPRCYLHPYNDRVQIDDDDQCVVEWDSNDSSSRRIKSSNCKECIFNKKCSGVWREYGDLYPDLDLLPICE
jgi:MoaA/NifB/PqqE/SkfB family radical SAM enzyme